jgi:hypothetical protein
MSASDGCLPGRASQIAESHGRLSKQHVEVTGSCLLINTYSLMPQWFLIFHLVVRARSVPSIKKNDFFKKKLSREYF